MRLSDRRPAGEWLLHAEDADVLCVGRQRCEIPEVAGEDGPSGFRHRDYHCVYR